MTATYDRDTPLSPSEYAEVRRFGLAPELALTPPRDPWWWVPLQVLVVVALVVTAPVWIVGLVVFVAYSDRRIS
jgi:hypothetical protein